MDTEKLKKHAVLLEDAIHACSGQSKDVDFLSTYSPLIKAIAAAKAGKITSPRELGGLGYWLLENAGVRNIPYLSGRLAQFCTLLRGWELPNESALLQKASAEFITSHAEVPLQVDNPIESSKQRAADPSGSSPITASSPFKDFISRWRGRRK